MKRLVYSIWGGLSDDHVSSDDFKKLQFKKHHKALIEKQKLYADLCRADYACFDVGTLAYQDIQFLKIDKLCELSDEYDEILYLDMDVIPNTEKNIFDSFDLSKMCIHFNPPRWLPQHRELMKCLNNKDFTFSYMDQWVKCLIKKSMLLLDDIHGSDTVANTGVMCINSEAIKSMELKHKIMLADEVYEEALEDNFHPQRILDAWRKNNEVFISYILEKYDMKYNEIGRQWNYILDNKVKEYTPAGYFIHQVNKDFEVTLNAMAR